MGSVPDARHSLPRATPVREAENAPKRWNLWKLGSAGFGVCSLGAGLALGWTGWLFLRQLHQVHDSNIFTVMAGKGAGGTPGLQHSAVSVLSLAGTAAVLALASVALSIYGRRGFSTLKGATVQEPDASGEPTVEPAETPHVEVTAEAVVVQQVVSWKKRIGRYWNADIVVAFPLSGLVLATMIEDAMWILALAVVFSLAFISPRSGISGFGRASFVAVTAGSLVLVRQAEGVVSVPFEQWLFMTSLLYLIVWSIVHCVRVTS